MEKRIQERSQKKIAQIIEEDKLLRQMKVEE